MVHWRKIAALDRYEALKTAYTAERQAARKAGSDSRALPDAEDAARKALAEHGFASEADAVRSIKRIRAELRAPAVIDLNYTRKG